ncbi:hypothetical protein J6590_077337 [Homalodisca vitripennis]|nr:hypothetical protein J6590_077337 [Homalodisca vitripennis]
MSNIITLTGKQLSSSSSSKLYSNIDSIPGRSRPVTVTPLGFLFVDMEQEVIMWHLIHQPDSTTSQCFPPLTPLSSAITPGRHSNRYVSRDHT